MHLFTWINTDITESYALISDLQHTKLILYSFMNTTLGNLKTKYLEIKSISVISVQGEISILKPVSMGTRVQCDNHLEFFSYFTWDGCCRWNLWNTEGCSMMVCTKWPRLDIHTYVILQGDVTTKSKNEC